MTINLMANPHPEVESLSFLFPYCRRESPALNPFFVVSAKGPVFRLRLFDERVDPFREGKFSSNHVGLNSESRFDSISMN